MATRNRKLLDIGSQMVLAGLVVVACIAGIPPLIETVAQAVANSQADAALACRNCGVVEDVREASLGTPKYGVSTVSGEGLAMFLGLLSGTVGAGPVKIYEVAVRLQDGSVRVIREGGAPAAKRGDHVRVVTGRVEPIS